MILMRKQKKTKEKPRIYDIILNKRHFVMLKKTTVSSIIVKCLFQAYRFGVWRSLVARMVWDHEVGGSNPSTPTTLRQNTLLSKSPCSFEQFFIKTKKNS